MSCFRRPASLYSRDASSSQAVVKGLTEDLRQANLKETGRTPDICKYYNNEGGCKRTADKPCRALHLCSYFVKSRCKFNPCKRNHDVHDEQPHRILAGLGWDMQRKGGVILEELRERYNVGREENQPRQR